MTRTLVAGALSALLSSFATSAHEAWVQPGPGPVYPIEYGDFTPEVYPVSKVKTVTAYDSKGKVLKATVIATPYGANARIAGMPSVVALFFDNGYYSKSASGASVNLPKRQVPGATTTSHPLKYGKTILQWDDSAFKPLGLRIEIVPIGSGAPKAKSPMTLQVLFDGKPLADAELETVGVTAEGKGPHTDAEGRITIDIDHGIQRLAVLHKLESSGETDVDSTSVTAALLFVVE